MTPVSGSVLVTLWVTGHLGSYSHIVLHLAFVDLYRRVEKEKIPAKGRVLAPVVSSVGRVRLMERRLRWALHAARSASSASAGHLLVWSLKGKG